jgi:hypothetical protein
MNITNIGEIELCKSRIATIDEIAKYRNEKDPEYRLTLAYECNIPSDELYPEDLEQIMVDMDMALQETVLDWMKVKADEDGLIFEDIPNYGEHMSLEEWLGAVKFSGFIDYDGHSKLATINQVSNIMIVPSEANGYKFPEWATHIVWYNR